ncbi:hypothetical protein pEaSNUABM54_00033 [Erwinia phage pEa_SNUABM_54]|nr:hypothetical protein pEaSNUABM54_00033 [Erwinia phage pEa_SNUABM_54]
MYQHYNASNQPKTPVHHNTPPSDQSGSVGYAPYQRPAQPSGYSTPPQQGGYDPRSAYSAPADDVNSVRQTVIPAYKDVIRFVVENFNDPGQNARAGDDIAMHMESVMEPSIEHMLPRWAEFKALGGAIGENFKQSMGFSIGANVALAYIDGNLDFGNYIRNRFADGYGRLDLFVRPLEDVLRRAGRQHGNLNGPQQSSPYASQTHGYKTPQSSRMNVGQGKADTPFIVSGDQKPTGGNSAPAGGGHRSGICAAMFSAPVQSQPTQPTAPEQNHAAKTPHYAVPPKEPKAAYFGGASSRTLKPQEPTAEPVQPTIARPRADFHHQPAVSHQPVKHGNDPAFNLALDMMQRTAGVVSADDAMQHQPMLDIPPLSEEEFIEHHNQAADTGAQLGLYNEPDDGIVEDFNDYTFDPLDANNTATQISEFVYRLAHGGSVAGWSFYDPKTNTKARYPIERPFPVVYNALTHVKFVLVNKENRIIEIIKEKDTDMEMQDHIDDDLSVATKGHRVNILEVLNQTAQRMNVSENRKEVKENKAKGIDAVVATADRKAFDNKVISTTSDTVREMLVRRLGDVREVTIEGYHERRLTPLYLGEEGVKNLESFQHTVGAAATFKSFAELLPRAMSDLPESFVSEYTARLTAHFNDFLTTRLGVDFWIENFFEDFNDAYTEACDMLGERIAADKFQAEYKRFSRFAKVMPRSADGYTDVLGSSLTQPGFVVFTTSINTLTLPFTSEEGKDILPEDGANYQGVESTHTPELYKLLANLLRSGQETFNGEANVTRVITKDGKVYYVQTGAFSVEQDAFVLAHKSYLINHLS